VGLLTGLLLSQLTWAATPEISVQMRPVQFTGSPLIVDLALHNASKTSITIPDLSVRPDLVRFELRLAGRRERRFNSPSAAAQDATWTLHPGDQRELRLEVPGSGALPAGPVQLDIRVHTADPALSLPTQRLEIVSPRPVSGDLSAVAATPGTRHPDVVWVHQSGQDFHLVLHHQQGERRYQLPLARLDAQVQPWLSHSRIDASSERSVVWLTNSQQLHVLRLRGQRTRGQPAVFTLPWPRVEIVGHPITDKLGTLRIPIWVPAPSGSGGELRLATMSGKSRPDTPRVVRLDERPAQVLSTLDAAGTPGLMIVRARGVDGYTPPAATGSPWPRRPLWRPAGAGTALMVALGSYPEGPDHAGGTAMLLATRRPDGIATQWFSMQGNALQGPALVPDQGKLRQLLPRGEDWPALVFEYGTLVVGSARAKLVDTGVLAPAGDSALIWRTLTQDGPVIDRPVHALD
jgi:hypothetical protein